MYEVDFNPKNNCFAGPLDQNRATKWPAVAQILFFEPWSAYSLKMETMEGLDLFCLKKNFVAPSI